ncbi:MAG TPA: trypsin-like peptidase domain-containing protein [Gammaproteobacteria bacterium]|nr:trypsin-like peptidase domain-containing protein [Gammaproteobacteria bacterium]
MSRLAHLFLLAVACSSGLAAAQSRTVARAEGVVQPRAVVPRGPLSADERNTIGVFESVSPSVVYISTAQYVRDFFNRNVTRVPQGTGSGFVWDDQGRVVTNLHVVREAAEAQVRLGDQRSFNARLVGYSEAHDIAVLQIDVPTNLPPPIPVGSSADLRVGQTVLAIGNPFGLDHTLTTGIVSALNREVENEAGGVIDDVIQTDAAINPGNSGGPLIDSAGRLVGINTMIYSPSGAYAGIGFAVPVDTINRVVSRIIAYGEYVRPTLGIEARDDVSRQLLGDDKGVAVIRVVPGSPAARAGLRAAEQTAAGRVRLGDVIVAIDGQPTETMGAFVNLLDAHEFGERVTLTVQRGDQRIEVPVTLSAADETRVR